jgi:tRNA(Ile2) C34 agmatinyltransferase TiaS
MVQSRGQLPIDEAALELQLPRDTIRDMINSLVGLGVFSGYINWDKGVLYSQEASKLRELTKCPNCGGEITLSGKGVARCRFCGTEFFLS